MQKNSSDRFIQSIDGLRAIAVLAVLLFHVDFEWASGGFAGVDIFFVISGFLITRNIFHEVQAGVWSFGNFYVRRIARLLPALFVTIAATLFASWWILSPDDLERIGQSSIMAVLSLGNIFFWMEAGYFDAGSATKPLLHTWSLAVEEQFYIVWPAVFLILIARGRKAAFVGLLAIAIASLGAAYWFMSIDPSAVFYLTPFRAHQFAIGAMIALVGWLPTSFTSSVFAALAAFSIVVITVVVSESSLYIFSAVLPAILAGIILVTSRSAFSNRVLGSPVVVWIGRRSYSIYLAHWPLIVLWKLNTDLEFSVLDQIVAVFVSVLCGTMLFELVENRFRFKKGHSSARKRRSVFASVAFGLIALTAGAHYWGNQGYPSRLSDVMLAATGDFESRWADRQTAVKDGVCSHTTTSANSTRFDKKLCSSPPKSGRAYLVVGDSFANDSLLVLKAAYPDIYFGQLTVPGCLLRIPKQFAPGEQVDCRKLYEIAFSELIENPNYDGIVLSSNWQEGHYYRINDIINTLAGRDLDIVVIGQRVRFKDRLPAIVASSDSLKSAQSKANTLIRPEEFVINSVILERFSDRVKVIDFIELSCPEVCDIFNPDGQLIYMDDSHFSLAGVQTIAKRLKRKRPEL